MISDADRRRAIELIQEAQRAGARLIPACQVLKITVRTYERWRSAGEEIKSDGRPGAKRPKPKNSLSDEEEQKVVDTVNSPDYASKPPSQIVPDLADKGIYLASESTFYRILRKRKLQNHRGNSRPPVSKPPTSYVAYAPNEVWTWDITYLAGPVRGIYYKLYMILDIFSRKIVGWEVWEKESAEYASALIRKAKMREGVRNTLVLHSDNGSPMKAASFQATLAKLGITASHSRPRVSNDNPYSEAGFKTLKYRPDYPSKGFLSVPSARQWIASFVQWYHEVHRHSGIGFVTPLQRHTGEAANVLAKRTKLYQEARKKHPERWARSIRNWQQPVSVALNPTEDSFILEGGFVTKRSDQRSKSRRRRRSLSPSLLGISEP